MPQGWDSYTKVTKMGFGKDGKGIIVHDSTDVTLAALAGQDLVLNASSVSLDKDFRILKTEAIATLTEITSLEGAGLALYMTEGELTAAQIEEVVELSGPVALGDADAEEIASRWVRLMGVSPNNVVNATERSFENKQGGLILETNPRWTFRRRRTVSEGGWNWAVYNNGVTLTTGATVRIKATHYGVWV